MPRGISRIYTERTLARSAAIDGRGPNAAAKQNRRKLTRLMGSIISTDASSPDKVCENMRFSRLGEARRRIHFHV
jgi:hypothetical protein